MSTFGAKDVFVEGNDPESSFKENSLAWNSLVPPDPPEGPDREKLMRLQAELNRVDQETPFGSLTFSGEGDATFELDPQLQQQFEQRNQLRNALLGNATNRANQLPDQNFSADVPRAGSFDRFNPDTMQFDRSDVPDAGSEQRLARQLPQAATTEQLASDIPQAGGQAAGSLGPFDQSTQAQKATFERAMNMIEPQMEERERELRQTLANQGLPTGSEAFNDEFSQFQEDRNRALEDAAFRAVQAGNQRQSEVFQQGLAESQEGRRAQNQAFSQGMNRFGARSDLQNQVFQQGLAELGAEQELDQQSFQQAQQARQTNLNQQNQIFQQGLAELGAQQQIRNQNLNEIQAMLQGQQVGQNIEGQGQNLGSFYSPSNIDVLGSAGLEQQANMNAYQAQRQQTSSNLGGIASLASAIFCSREYKKNGRSPDSFLPRLQELTVEGWDYKEGYGDEGSHIGPYAEDFQALFGLGNGKEIQPVDLFGVLILAVQELTHRVEAMENG